MSNHSPNQAKCEKCGQLLPEPGAPCPSCLVAAADCLTGETITLAETHHDAAYGEQAGTMVGHYKLLQKIGEGGFGIVWMAEQTEPVVRRVALKVVKLGMDTKQVIARFEAERQALALMDHPNIAKVLDAGATESGRPFFAMELVKGVPITHYCDKNKLSARRRLELFMLVCQAIQHAHQKGVIHRDIKPSNVMVTLHDGVPVPKVIDFGIAKAINQRLTEKTLFTNYAQMIGTPAYMSPEQAEMSGLDVDTRSDIYSLGVLLYELLTGTTPFPSKHLLSLGYGEMQRVIAEEEPPRPSTRLSTMADEELTVVAKNRNLDVSSIGRRVQGELDWIVMKSLEKDRTRRYETVNALRVDVERHLNDETVSAVAPSRGYQLRKLYQKHRGAFAVAAWTLGVLALGAGVSLWQAIRATKAENVQTQLRLQAEDSEREAKTARDAEAALRRRAEAQELAARRRAYAGDMNLANQAIHQGDWGRAWFLLDRHRPTADRSDLRGWEWRYLWQVCQSDASFTFAQRPGLVLGMAISNAGTHLATAEAFHGPVTLWNVATKEIIAEVSASRSTSKWVKFSPDDSLLAYAHVHTDGTPGVFLWSMSEQRIVQSLRLQSPCGGFDFGEGGRSLVVAEQNDPQEIASISFIPSVHAPPIVVSPDGRFAVCGGDSEEKEVFDTPFDTLHVVELPSGKIRWSRELEGEEVSAIAVSPDGATIAAVNAYTPSPIHLLDAEDGSERSRLSGHRAWVSILLFEASGNRLFAASADRMIHVWDVRSGDHLGTMQGHQHEVWSLVYSQDHNRFISGDKEGEILAWENPSKSDLQRTPLKISPVSLKLDPWPLNGMNWQFSPNDDTIIFLGNDRRAYAWHWQRGIDEDSVAELFDIEPATGMGLCLSSDCSRLAMGSTTGRVRLQPLHIAESPHVLDSFTGPVMPIAFYQNDSRLLLYTHGDTTVRDWDMNDMSEKRSWALGEWRWAWSSLFHLLDNEEKLICGNRGGNAVIIDLSDGKVTVHDPMLGSRYAVSASNDGKLLAISGAPGVTKVWHLGDDPTIPDGEIATLGGHLTVPHSVVFSLDGTRLVSGGGGSSAMVFWDTESWEETLTLTSEGSHHWHSAFSPDQNAVASSNMVGDLYVWSAPSWEAIEEAEARRDTQD